jgi:hypothetical protein
MLVSALKHNNNPAQKVLLTPLYLYLFYLEKNCSWTWLMIHQINHLFLCTLYITTSKFKYSIYIDEIKWSLSHKIIFKECDFNPSWYSFWTILRIPCDEWTQVCEMCSILHQLTHPLELMHSISNTLVIHPWMHQDAVAYGSFIYSCSSGWAVFLPADLCIYWPACHMYTNQPQCHLPVQTWLPYCCTSETYEKGVLFRR